MTNADIAEGGNVARRHAPAATQGTQETMSGIPERGYGTWGQWRRRALGMIGRIHFCVNDGNNEEAREWQKYHMRHLPSDLHIIKGNLREATEAQV